MLKTYREKRDFSKTPEPKGRKKALARKLESLSFVVQEHAATRLHFDFRLEANGVLLSWAVPKGPSLNPHEKRLAVMTEDHPLDYAGFEGIIPSGYGAGEVIVWDNGTYAPLDSGEIPILKRNEAEKLVKAGLKRGKLSIQLQGKKLKGIWTLVRLKNKEKDWLLIKHEDEFASGKGHPWLDDSVLSGQTLADLQSRPKEKRTSSKLAKSKSKTKKRLSINSAPIVAVKKKNVGSQLPEFRAPMLATLATDSFADQAWLFEPKLDGIRALAYINNNEVRLYSRRGLLITQRYPLLIKELSGYKENLILDGEIVALDKNGRPSFEKLQERSGLTKKDDIAKAEANNPIVYYVFDIIFFNGKDLSPVPLKDRKKILREIVAHSKYVKIVEEMGSDGKLAFKTCVNNGLEGVVGKRLASSYQAGRRSPDWLKIKSTQSAEFLICGYTRGTGSRKSTFGALILGEHNQKGKMVYVCNVGTGFDQKRLGALLKSMKSLETKICPFITQPSGLDSPTWLKPQLVAEIKYAERTKEGHLRIPVFLHLREDIEPEKVKPPAIIQVNTRTVKESKSDSKKNKCPIENILADLDKEQENLELDVQGDRIVLSHLE